MADAKKSCGSCEFYAPLKGEPPAGYCLFVEHRTLPFWMDANLDSMKLLRHLPGNDVIPTDGEHCDAHRAATAKSQERANG